MVWVTRLLNLCNYLTEKHKSSSTSAPPYSFRNLQRVTVLHQQQITEADIQTELKWKSAVKGSFYILKEILGNVLQTWLNIQKRCGIS